MIKLFLKKIVLISLPVIAFMLWTFWQANGYSDAFYRRFTTPRQASLILGTSRAAQGILPQILDEILDKDIFNFAMTMANSPYGPVYYQGIKKKLNLNSRDGLFVLEISPWSICSISEDPNDRQNFREADLFLANIHFMNINPNVEYLMKSYAQAYIKLWQQKPASMYLHQNGWLEVTIPMDSVARANRIAHKMKLYRETQLPKYHLSTLRIDYLKRTIDLLKKHGQVVLVRVPIHKEMLAIENKLMPDFTSLIQELAKKQGVAYLDYSEKSAEYLFTDGNHLWKESAQEFSTTLARDIAGL